MALSARFIFIVGANDPVSWELYAAATNFSLPLVYIMMKNVLILSQ